LTRSLASATRPPTPPTQPAAARDRNWCVIVLPSRLYIVSTTRKRALPLIMRS
jgi:hypothetical protein